MYPESLTMLFASSFLGTEFQVVETATIFDSQAAHVVAEHERQRCNCDQ
jgi:hypothetical protein